MEDVELPPQLEMVSGGPEAGHDPNDPLRPEIDEENSTPTPPVADPTLDMEVTEDAEDKEDGLDDESDLSEIDEAQFEDFDAANVAIEERPIMVDESNVNALGVHKRKRTEGEEASRKKKERKREKPKKSRKRREDDDNFSGGEELEGKRNRKKEGGERRERARTTRKATPEDDESLTPEERRRRALDRAMDAALRNPNKRLRKKDGIDLETLADEEIQDMRKRMGDAAAADLAARERGEPAMLKLRMLPEVISLLSRRTIQNSIVDPDNNLMEGVRFFLEPLSDGSMPAYNIQRELFAALEKLPITKDTLIASGLGKVVHFYTKSPKVEANIKRQADRLVNEWKRPILRRTDDYRKKEFKEAEYDPNRLPIRPSQGGNSQLSAATAAAREKMLATPTVMNRARITGSQTSYTIVPKNNVVPGSQPVRAPGAAGDAFRRLKATQAKARR
ncbi:hypothetical protein M501DRAFT_1002761 [Patellaria atrata CBS 101060]|uniref:TFIIS N-terminal domain-containing protein n=1 Tax=Patellaria atrata CBS 101060 TaxID=1346257 RepID=A0A9P4SDK2_9PEZI|nr:hypothetical protein M501DRAFT_1002761 [Patellaria atrata CBS 101060]